MLDARTGLLLSHSQAEELLRLTGTTTAEDALAAVRDLLCPEPKKARVGIMWDDVVVTNGHEALCEVDYEQRELSARVRFRGGRVERYSQSYRIAHSRLQKSKEPDKLRAHIDNRMQNVITEQVMRDAYL